MGILKHHYFTDTVLKPTKPKNVFAAFCIACAVLVSTLMLVLPGVTPATAGAETIELSKRIQHAVDGHILPRLRQFTTQAEELNSNIARYCASGQRDDWDKTKSSFGATVTDWAAASHLRFGPVTFEGRARRLSFWPDPRGIVWRQLRRVLSKRDEVLLEPGALAKQSVAIQGLTALEIILNRQIPIGEKATPGDLYKCDLATAISRNIAATSQSIIDEWTANSGWRQRLLHPGKQNDIYPTTESAAAELVKSAVLGFQIIRDQQIEVLQQAMNGKKKVSRLPFHRSNLAADYLRASINGSCELVKKLDLTFYVPDKKAWIRNWIPKGCNVLMQLSKNMKIPRSNDEFPGNLDAFDLRQLRFHANGMRQIIGRDIAPAAGLTIGFNELDGD